MGYTRDTPPPRLYKYQPFSGQTLTALKVRTIWFGRASNLNDPFDCAVPIVFAPVTLDGCRRLLDEKTSNEWTQLKSQERYVTANGEPTELLRQAVERQGQATFRDHAEKGYLQQGVSCFSEEPDNTLLWSHYGGGHRGICLELDTSSPVLHRLHKVHYTDEIPVVDVVDEMTGNGSATLPHLITKAACWSYEKEWRAIHKEAETEYGYGVETLTSVYIVAKLTYAENDVVCHILYGFPNKIYEVYRAEGSLKLLTRRMGYEPYSY
jgi:hypothetical protein